MSPPAPNTLLRRELSGHAEAGRVRTSTRLSRRRVRRGRIRYIINTSAAPEHVGGNEKLAAAANFRRAGGAGGFGGAVRESGRRRPSWRTTGCSTAMSTPADKAPPRPKPRWPMDTFFDEFYKLSEYVNGEPVILYHAKAANTDGDSFVFFRHSEVIAAGNLFSTISYPLIDTDKGGTIQGVIDGLNQILDLVRGRVPRRRAARGSFRAAAGCRIPPTSRRIATCW